MNNARRAKLTKARGLIAQAKKIIAQAASEEREHSTTRPQPSWATGPRRPPPSRPGSKKPMAALTPSSPHST